MTSYAAEENKSFTRFSAECEETFLTYSSPGNVRQLQNVVRNAVVMNDGEAVTLDMLPAPLDRFVVEARRELSDPPIPDVSSPPVPSDPTQLIVPLARLEREAIERAIELCDGNVPRAAHDLGVSGATIYRRRAAWQMEAESG